ncbi:unnamed protein product, partial [Amoebophrya sp. A120]|eukprot:GSA120T00010163001.1
MFESLTTFLPSAPFAGNVLPELAALKQSNEFVKSSIATVAKMGTKVDPVTKKVVSDIFTGEAEQTIMVSFVIPLFKVTVEETMEVIKLLSQVPPNDDNSLEKTNSWFYSVLAAKVNSLAGSHGLAILTADENEEMVRPWKGTAKVLTHQYLKYKISAATGKTLLSDYFAKQQKYINTTDSSETTEKPAVKYQLEWLRQAIQHSFSAQFGVNLGFLKSGVALKDVVSPFLSTGGYKTTEKEKFAEYTLNAANNDFFTGIFSPSLVPVVWENYAALAGSSDIAAESLEFKVHLPFSHLQTAIPSDAAEKGNMITKIHTKIQNDLEIAVSGAIDSSSSNAGTKLELQEVALPNAQTNAGEATFIEAPEMKFQSANSGVLAIGAVQTLVQLSGSYAMKEVMVAESDTTDYSNTDLKVLQIIGATIPVGYVSNSTFVIKPYFPRR